MIKIMFLLEHLLKFSYTNYINNVSVLIMVRYSSFLSSFPIYI